MKRSTYSLSLVVVTLISLSEWGGFGAPNTVWAQMRTLQPPNPAASAQRLAQRPSRSGFTQRRLPPGRSAPGRNRGGGTRGECPVVAQELTALVPFVETPERDNLAPSTDVWGYTSLERPTLWVYMPYTAAQGVPLQFSVQDEDTAVQLFEITIPAPKQAGFLAIPLPVDQPGLQVGKFYKWFLEAKCQAPNGGTATTPIYVSGILVRDRLDPGLASQLSNLSQRQRASLLAQQGFWFDALNLLASQRRQNPDLTALKEDWRSLLGSMNLSPDKTKSDLNLDALANQPFAQ
jgi:hypothetical protein